jgi:hypothetical protein
MKLAPVGTDWTLLVQGMLSPRFPEPSVYMLVCFPNSRVADVYFLTTLPPPTFPSSPI